MQEKTYRPKADYEGFALTVNMGQGKTLDLDALRFPYTTEDSGEQAYLDSREELTDRPDTTKKSAGNASGSDKEA